MTFNLFHAANVNTIFLINNKYLLFFDKKISNCGNYLLMFSWGKLPRPSADKRCAVFYTFRIFVPKIF